MYCNPDADSEDERRISDGDIKEILSAAAAYGIDKVHYSGGEPTLRKFLPEIMKHARAVGFVNQAMTTNGLLLKDKLQEYIESGLCRVNISLDSLNAELNSRLTGVDGLTQVLESTEAALNSFETVKLNIVAMKSNLDEVEDFVRLSDRFGGRLIVRFIELQSNQPAFFSDSMESEFVSIDEVLERVRRLGLLAPIDVSGKNPNCRYYKVMGTRAVIGEIANTSRGYPCGGCRKIRISPYGDMGVCINAEGVNVRCASLTAKQFAFEQLLKLREDLDVHNPDRRHLSEAKGFWRWGDVSKGRSHIKIDRHRVGATA